MTTIRLYRTLITLVLLYGFETWKMNKGNEKRIDVFQNNSLRRILKIKWQDKITTQEILQLSNMRKEHTSKGLPFHETVLQIVVHVPYSNDYHCESVDF